MILPAKDNKHRLLAEATVLAFGLNVLLAFSKISAGILGNSAALIADGIESFLDIISSCIMYAGLHVASRPPDTNHPHGHGKAETLAGLLIAVIMIIAAVIITIESIESILSPAGVPAGFTIIVLCSVICIKELLYRYLKSHGERSGSIAMITEASHHRTDALTSLFVLPGVILAYAGGPSYAYADGVGALIACGFIYWNGVRFAWLSGRELIDTRIADDLEDYVRREAQSVDGVIEIEKCLLRKSGIYILVDIHVLVYAELTVAEGHEIAHRVKDHLIDVPDLAIQDVLVHIEPYEDESEASSTDSSEPSVLDSSC